MTVPRPLRQADARPLRRGNWLLGLVLGVLSGFATYWAGALLAASQELVAQSPGNLVPLALRPFTTFTAWELALGALGGLLGIAVSKYRWRLAGVLSYVGLVSLIVGYLAYSLTVSIPLVPPEARWLSYILLAAEGGGLSLIVVFSFYSLDAATRRRWVRMAEGSPYDPAFRPKVALMVPVFNEPFPMVRQTILQLLAQDYPRDRLMVVVADDSTDPATREPLAQFCAEVGATYLTRDSRRGYKAGALNSALLQVPPSFGFIAVVDADYWVEPDYVRSIVGYFADPALSFVQTPQDYRNADESFLTRQYKRAESYFYHAIMPSRNEQSAIIFCGTMGMLRRSALEEVGRFAEDQICEDAEVSVRLAAAGWESLYVDRSFAKGLMPAVFEAYKKQFHRWAFGNVKILFSRSWLILRSRMGARQKVDFLVSNLHWFDGFFVATIALVLLFLGLGPIFGYEGVVHHERELAMLAFIPIFLMMDGLVRLHLVLRLDGNTTIRQSLLVQGMWFAIKFTNMAAATKCMLGVRTPFIRTSKETNHRLGRWRSFGRALRVAKVESLVGLALLSTSVGNAVLTVHHGPTWGTVLLPAWLALYSLFFLCAPLYAYLSYRTLSPAPRAGPVHAGMRARGKGAKTVPTN